jgi:hypothetical protein
VIGSIPGDVPVDAVAADSRRGAALAVKHLAAHGRRRIGLVNGPVSTTPGHARRLGYLDGLRAVKHQRDERLIDAADDFTVEAGRDATLRLLGRTASYAPTTCSRLARLRRCARPGTTSRRMSRSSGWTTARSPRSPGRRSRASTSAPSSVHDARSGC